MLEPHVMAIDVHYHHWSLIWILFVFGMLLHWLLQVWRLAQESHQPMNVVMKANWVPMLWRSFLSGLIFTAIWEHPDMIAQILKFVGHPISADESAVLSWPMNNTLAGAYGLGLDSLLGYLPWLKSQLPPVDAPVQKALAVAAASTAKAGEAIATAQDVVKLPPPEAAPKP